MAMGEDPSSSSESSDPAQALAAAEEAHLAARRTAAQRGGEDNSRQGAQGTSASEGGNQGRNWQGGSPDTPATDRPGSSTGTGKRTPAPLRRAPLPVAAAVATGWAALLSFTPAALLVTLLMFAETGPSGLLDPLRVAAAGWLLGHGLTLHTPEGPIGITPLAITLLAAWRVARAGVHVTRAMGARHRRSVRQALVAAVSVAVGYGGFGALAALAVDGGRWGIPVLGAGAALAAFGLVTGGYGALAATGVLRVWAARLPVVLPAGVRAGVMAAAGILAAGAALAGVALAVSWRPAGDTLAVYETGVAGQAGLTILCLAYLPNLAVWAAAYLLGPGFVIGAGALVRSSEVTVGQPLPLPVLAAVPDGALPTLGAVLLVVPVVAGAFAGRSVVHAVVRPPRLVRTVSSWLRIVSGVLVSAVVAGALLGGAAFASGGALGVAELAHLGPDPLLVAGFSAAAVAAGALVGAAASAVLVRRRGE